MAITGSCEAERDRGNRAPVVLCAIAFEERAALYEMAQRFWEELMPHAPYTASTCTRAATHPPHWPFGKQ